MEGLNVEQDERNLECYHRIWIGEIKDAFKRTDMGISIGADGIPFEVWECVGEKFGSLRFLMRFWDLRQW